MNAATRTTADTEAMAWHALEADDVVRGTLRRSEDNVKP
jgi:hypothetical protein